jgi:hypothetical protein
MGEGWSEAEAFGELRSLMSRRPSAEAFARVCALVDEAEEAAPGLYAERWRGYLLGHLGRWQPRHRTVVLRERAAAEAASAAPWAELVEGVDLEHFDLNSAADVDWIAGELRGRFPEMEHLGVRTTSMKKAAIVRSCEAGVFDGLRSLVFDRCEVRPVTLEVLMGRLEENDELEHLVFDWCGFGAPQIERVSGTTLAPRLKTLGMPNTERFKPPQAAELARLAPEFEVLERLELRACSLAGAGTKSIAMADWSDTLARMDLGYNGIRGVGVQALIDSGRMEMLFDEGDERSLNLLGQRIGNKGLEALVAAGLLEGIGRLDLRGCNLTRLSALTDIEDLSALRGLRVVGNAWATREDGAALLSVLERARALEELSVERCGLPGSFVADLLATPAAETLRDVRLTSGRHGRREDLEALLAWDRLDEVALGFTLLLPARDPLIARAELSGRFVARAPRYDGMQIVEAVEG